MDVPEFDPRIEACVTAHRIRDAEGRPEPPPEWWDLPAESLDRVYRHQLQARELERRLDPEGLSTTVRAVLARMR
jgi:hypothetical protein